MVVADRLGNRRSERIQPRRADGRRSRRAGGDRHRRRVRSARARRRRAAAGAEAATGTAADRSGRRRRGCDGGARWRPNRRLGRCLVGGRAGGRDRVHTARSPRARAARRVLGRDTHRVDCGHPTRRARRCRRRIGVIGDARQFGRARDRLPRRSQRGRLRAVVPRSRPHRWRRRRTHGRHHPCSGGPDRPAVRPHHDCAERHRWLRARGPRGDSWPTPERHPRPTRRDSRGR